MLYSITMPEYIVVAHMTFLRVKENNSSAFGGVCVCVCLCVCQSVTPLAFQSGINRHEGLERAGADVRLSHVSIIYLPACSCPLHVLEKNKIKSILKQNFLLLLLMCHTFRG